MNKPHVHIGIISQKDYGKDALTSTIDKVLANRPVKTNPEIDLNSTMSQEIIINKPREDTEFPHFVEDNHHYNGKSYFANIDKFSKQACQPFPNIGGKVSFSSVKGE